MRRGALYAASRPLTWLRSASASTVGAVGRLDDADDRLAEAVVGHADDDGVAHGRVRLQHLLDLLGEHLLAARVDAHRPAAEEVDRAVGVDRGEVAGDAPAASVDDAERGRRLGVVLVVADGQEPADGDHADLARPRLDAAAVVGEHGVVLGDREVRRLPRPHPAADTEAPRPTASDEPKESKRIACGMWRRSPCLFSWLHITPGRRDRRARSTGRSGRGSASRCSSIGPANAWPTITTFVARWRSTVSNSSAASKRRLASDTTVPPPVIAMSAENCPVPCISGTGDDHHRRALGRRDAGGDLGGVGGRSGAGERVAARAEHVEQVVLAPHHALRHAGRAAGVEQQQVVAARG